VAVIDTESWSIVRNVETGYRPSRLALGKSGARLWVLQQNENAEAAAVTVIDTATLEPVARLKTGRGPHQLVFGADDVQAFVSNGGDGTVSIVETASLRNLGEIRTGTSVDGLAYTSLGNAVYAIDGGDGTIALLDLAGKKVAKRITAMAGINSIQFAPGGRWGFVTNGKENAVHVIDASTASLITTAHDVGTRPDQIAFTDEFAYVHAAGSDQVKMIRLAGLGTDAEPSIATFPAGQLPPDAARAESFAAAIVPSPEPKSVLVANPADRIVYYYSEGMAAPMGNLEAKGRTPKAVLVVDRSLKEGAPSVFSIRTQVPAAGKYDVAFYLDNPRVVHCFALDVQPDPAAPPKPVEQTLAIEPLLAAGPIVSGRNLEIKFRLSDAATHELRRGVSDLRALAFLAPGTWQMRIDAKPDADGLYRVTVPVQEPGIYYVFLESPSLKLKINRARPLIFQAVAEEVTGR
jgi:DNA-binding beta-propeller fold protein YncE